MELANPMFHVSSKIKVVLRLQLQRAIRENQRSSGSKVMLKYAGEIICFNYFHYVVYKTNILPYIAFLKKACLILVN